VLVQVEEVDEVGGQDAQQVFGIIEFLFFYFLISNFRVSVLPKLRN
jgi:hypothetical protein